MKDIQKNTQKINFDAHGGLIYHKRVNMTFIP